MARTRRRVVHQVTVEASGAEDSYLAKYYPSGEYPSIDYIYHGDDAEAPGGMSLDDFIAAVSAASKMVPEAYRASARVATVGGGECGDKDDVRVVISYIHPETDKQLESRLARESAETGEHEARERAELARLERKYKR